MARFVDVVGDIKLLFNLYRIFRAGSFDMVCTITVKPNVYGAIAARLARVKTVVAMIEGLGFPLGEGHTLKQKLVRYITSQLYWVSCTLCDRVGFSNSDDLTLFLGRLHPAVVNGNIRNVYPDHLVGAMFSGKE
jgi:hypothetical protein